MDQSEHEMGFIITSVTTSASPSKRTDLQTASKAALTWAWAGEDVKMFTVTLLLHVNLNVDGYQIKWLISWSKEDEVN